MSRPMFPFALGSVLLTALAPILWGTTYLVATEYLPEGRPLWAAVIRTLPAGLLLIAYTRQRVHSISWGRLLLLSALNISAFQALLFVAAYRLPGGIAAIAGALQPLIILALAWGVDQIRPSGSAVGTALCAVAGMALLILSPEAKWDLVGICAALTASVSMAAGIFLSRRWKSDMPLLAFTGWQLALGGLLLLPLAIFIEPPLASLSMTNIVGYTYLSILGTLFAYALWFRGIARLSSVAVSALGLLSPVTAILLGWLMLGETMRLREILGILIVLASVFALQWQRRVTPKGDSRRILKVKAA
ncbi:EamA family transporter [Coraliomargarita algicola]|uniref:EamA family transporter n=1 Tax=Coraliomargarita algicola TaxID=3092156 RepID=A0ABZ0RPP8_9BACT|nr:EamA family transporter [Coraliomargarita sp. J2-16]WPJ97497.1 EamA family transporter [Coraliomargarita sp. J2-16]